MIAPLVAPSFIITVLVIIASAILLALGHIGATEWLTATAGAGGIYTMRGVSSDREQINAARAVKGM